MSTSTNPSSRPPPSAVAKMAVAGLSAWYGDVQALHRISMRLEAGRVTAVIGPSGCGKSTFVRCLNRMHELTEGARMAGSVLLDGVEIAGPDIDTPALRSRVGLIAQRPNPFPQLSIRDNVLSGLKLAGRPCIDPDAVVEEALRRVGLWDELAVDLDGSPLALSVGAQQRLCIARALALEPDVLLLDEPCAALDPIATARIEETIHDLRERCTVVIVTHSMQQAARVSDYTAFFYLGELVEYDLADVIFTRPSDPRTENYLTGRFG